MCHPVSAPSTTTLQKRGWRKFLERLGSWLQHKDKSEWLKDMRGNLSLMATVIATMTFQSAINPPGGVAQADSKDGIKCSDNDTSRACPGEAVLAVLYRHDYVLFLVYNTICFIASLSVCLLLVSGLPLNHRLPTWLLSIGMCITITSLALTYLYGAAMVTPDAIWNSASNVFDKVLKVWTVLSGIVGFLIILRFVVRAVQSMKGCKTPTTPESNEHISIDDA